MYSDQTISQENMPINMVPRALREHGVAVSYSRLWRAAVEGRFAAHKKGARWYVNVTDLPEIAAVFAREDV